MTTTFLNQQIYSPTNFFTQPYLYLHAKCQQTAQTHSTFRRFIECLEEQWRILNEISHNKGLETLKQIVLQCKQQACCIFREKIGIYQRTKVHDFHVAAISLTKTPTDVHSSFLSTASCAIKVF